MKRLMSRWATVGLTLLVSACASFDARRGNDETAELLGARGAASVPTNGPVDCAGDAGPMARQIAQPLTRDSAVAIALSCNPSLAAAYARLGIANTEAYDAVRLANPTLSLGVAESNAPGVGARIDLGIAQNFTGLILRGPRTRLAEGEFLRAQFGLAGTVMTLAAEVETAHARLVAAMQVELARATIAEASAVSAEMARRFRAAGNFSARELALAEAASIDASIEHRHAIDESAEARARLQVLLGVGADSDWKVIDSVAVPPFDELTLADLRATADRQRLDLASARKLVDLLADAAQTSRRIGWLGEFEVGIEAEREPDGSRLLGPTLSIQLPLFHQGQGSVARAGYLHTWSVAEQRRLSHEVDADVELAWQRMESARARVIDYRERLLPRRAAVVARTQEDVNFMLRGVFELLDARIDEYSTAIGLFESLRDYWSARSALERAIGARLPLTESSLVDARAVLGIDASPSTHDSMHEGHVMPPAAPADDAMHEGHAMPPATSADDAMHEGHAMPPATPADDAMHKGHVMPPAKPADPPKIQHHDHGKQGESS